MSTNKPGSQSISIGGNVNATGKGNVNFTQSMTTGDQPISPTNPAEFMAELTRLLAEISKISGSHSDFKEAKKEVASALTETQKPKPEPTSIRRFLNNAKSLLEGAAEVAAPAIKLAAAIATLAKMVPQIFGS